MHAFLHGGGEPTQTTAYRSLSSHLSPFTTSDQRTVARSEHRRSTLRSSSGIFRNWSGAAAEARHRMTAHIRGRVAGRTRRGGAGNRPQAVAENTAAVHMRLGAADRMPPAAAEHTG